jgi:hypothetical protein
MPLILNGDGSVGPLSATEVGYLDGVTSAVQTQVNNAAIFSVQIERNAGFTGSIGQIGAFGNGATDGYMVLPFAVDLSHAAMRVSNLHTGTTTVQLTIDGTLQGTGYQLSCTGVSSFAIGNYSSSLKRINAGQGFNWASTATSGTLGTTVISMIFVRV